MKKEVVDFTKGKPIKLILPFYVPLLLTSLLQQIYNFVDALIVGQGLGDNALAAVGNMGSIFFLIVGFSFGLANGFGVLIAQSFGAKDYELLRRRIASTIKLACGLAVVLTTLSIIFLEDILIFLRTDDVIINDSLSYGYIIFAGLFTSISYNVCASILRALGDSKTPLRAIIISSILNLSLDSLFIFVFHMGVWSAAIATVVSQVVSTLVCFNRLRQISIIRLKREEFHNERKIYFDLIKNGVTMAFMNSITAVVCMVVQYFVNGYGVNYTSAYAACSKYLNLFMNPACTAGHAMSAFTSQNYGAKKYNRIKEGLKVCLGIALISYLTLGMVMVFAPRFLADILLDGSTPIRLASQFLPICGVSIIAVDCLFVFRTGVQAMGEPMIPMWSGVAEMVLRIGAISLFMKDVGFKATAYAEVAAWVGALLMNMIAFAVILGRKTEKAEAPIDLTIVGKKEIESYEGVVYRR